MNWDEDYRSSSVHLAFNEFLNILEICVNKCQVFFLKSICSLKTLSLALYKHIKKHNNFFKKLIHQTNNADIVKYFRRYSNRLCAVDIKRKIRTHSKLFDNNKSGIKAQWNFFFFNGISCYNCSPSFI